MARGTDNPRQDRRAGLSATTLGDRLVTKYDPEMALRIIEQVAQGKLLKHICAPDAGYCSTTTFYNWLARVPELQKAYAAAREISALRFEEEAIEAAQELQKSPGDNSNIRANEVLIGQMRWSASKRDPRNYGERGNQAIVVPVHIETSLNMGDGRNSGTSAEVPDIYTIAAEDITEVPAAEPAVPTLNLTVEDMGSEKTAIGHRPRDGGRWKHKVKLTPRVKEKKDAG